MKNIVFALIAAGLLSGCQTVFETQKVSFAHWNIGHFSNGQQCVSAIDKKDGFEQAQRYSAFVDRFEAEIFGVCEYSEAFTTNGTQKASKCVFSRYPASVIGPTSAFQCDALFLGSRFNVVDKKIKYFADHNQDVYYVAVKVKIGLVDVWFVETHLDWQTYHPAHSNDRISQMNQLIEDFKNEPRVVIGGDFNVGIRTPGGNTYPAPEEYAVFEKAGYQLANRNGTGTYPSGVSVQPLDNVIVKGGEITEVTFADAKGYSDHDAVYCEITFTYEVE